MLYSPNEAGKCKACGGDGEHNGKVCLICNGSGRCTYYYGDGDYDTIGRSDLNGDSELKSTPGFELILVLSTIALMVIIKKKNEKILERAAKNLRKIQRILWQNL